MLRRAADAFGTAEDYPVKRIVAPAEIAQVVRWLASPGASAVHGTNIDASAGDLAQ